MNPSSLELERILSALCSLLQSVYRGKKWAFFNGPLFFLLCSVLQRDAKHYEDPFQSHKLVGGPRPLAAGFQPISLPAPAWRPKRRSPRSQCSSRTFRGSIKAAFIRFHCLSYYPTCKRIKTFCLKQHATPLGNGHKFNILLRINLRIGKNRHTFI